MVVLCLLNIVTKVEFNLNISSLFFRRSGRTLFVAHARLSYLDFFIFSGLFSFQLSDMKEIFWRSLPRTSSARTQRMDFHVVIIYQHMSRRYFFSHSFFVHIIDWLNIVNFVISNAHENCQRIKFYMFLVMYKDGSRTLFFFLVFFFFSSNSLSNVTQFNWLTVCLYAGKTIQMIFISVEINMNNIFIIYWAVSTNDAHWNN